MTVPHLLSLVPHSITQWGTNLPGRVPGRCPPLLPAHPYRGRGRWGTGTGDKHAQILNLVPHPSPVGDGDRNLSDVANLDTSTGPPRSVVEGDAQGNSHRPRLTFFHLADRAATHPGTIPC